MADLEYLKKDICASIDAIENELQKAEDRIEELEKELEVTLKSLIKCQEHPKNT